MSADQGNDFQRALNEGVAAFVVETGKQEFGCRVGDEHLHMTVVDLVGLNCPEPLMLLRQALRQGAAGAWFLVIATDLSTERDFSRYCEFSGVVMAASGKGFGDGSLLGFIFRKPL